MRKLQLFAVPAQRSAHDLGHFQLPEETAKTLTIYYYYHYATQNWNLCLQFFRMWNERMNYAYRICVKMCIAGMLTSIQKLWATRMAYRMRWCTRQHYSGDFHCMNWHDQLQYAPCWSVSAMLLASLYKNYTSLCNVKNKPINKCMCVYHACSRKILSFKSWWQIKQKPPTKCSIHTRKM